MEIRTVNGWGGGGIGGNVYEEMRVQSIRDMGKDFCPIVLQPFLENIDRRSCNDESRELIPVFHIPHRKCRPSSSVVARTLENLVGVSSSDQPPREYLECYINIDP